MTRACIIGISGYGEVHYHDLLRAVEAGTMEAIGATVIDRDQQEEKCRRLESLGCRIFTDHREMLDCFRGGVDLCFIPTGIPLHAPMTADALEAGANVYVEKPAAPTIQDVRAMEAAQSVSERFVAVGYQHMYADATLELKERLLSGEFGAIHWIRVRNASPRPASYYARNGWSGQVMRGGVWVLDAPFNNAHAHYVNMALFLAGTDVLLPAKLSSVQAELYRARDIDTADTACIRAITEQGVPVSYFGSHSCARANGPFIRLIKNKTAGKKSIKQLSYSLSITILIECNFHIPETKIDNIILHGVHGGFAEIVKSQNHFCPHSGESQNDA